MLFGKNITLRSLRSRGVEPRPCKACDNTVAQCDRGAVSMMSWGLWHGSRQAR